MPGKPGAKEGRTPRAATPRKASPKGPEPSKTGPVGKASKPAADEGGSRLVDQHIQDLEGWRAQTLAHVRALIREADPDVVEDVKWRKPSNAMRGVAAWSHDGLVCTGETYKDKVKLTFAKGASVPDPAGLFNSSLDAGTRRAIDLHEGEMVDARAFKALVKAAVAANGAGRKQ